MMFRTDQLAIVDWCARQCEHQRSGELSVSWMVTAYAHTCRLARRRWLYTDAVLYLARLVEPTRNQFGTRKVPVSIAGGIPLSWETVDHELNNLLSAQSVLSPDEFYREFETIHPFADGNGRIGALLYNWKGRTLNHPVDPPLYRRGGY